jgi:hypothetical protein
MKACDSKKHFIQNINLYAKQKSYLGATPIYSSTRL